jgi:NADH-quinone oxidoreductase subunit H
MHMLAAAGEPAPLYDGIAAWLKIASGLGHHVWLDPVWILAAALVPVLTWITLHGFFAIWLERKVAAHMQCRLGPMEVGSFHGWAQTIADGVKLLAKEDIIPRAADRPLFILAPIIAFAATFAIFLVLPFGGIVDTGSERFKLTAHDLDLGVFFIAAISSLEAIGVILAGWASNNKWSLFGAMRTATQVVSYEIPLGIALLTVVLVAGTFSLHDIAVQQEGGFWNWYLFRSPFLFVAFVVLFICNLAEAKRAPFDLPEAESELVSGFHTEYSGMRFSIFFLAEYSAMYAIGVLTAVLFLGGWSSGIPALDAVPAIAVPLGIAMVLGKAILLVFVQMWLRWTLPRVRLDHVMYLCLKVLVPFALVALLGAAIWEMVVGDNAYLFAVPFALFCAGVAAVLVMRLIALALSDRRGLKP